MTIEQRRRDDRGVLCWVAMRVSQAWDWIDKRDIDKHLMAWAVFYITYYMVFWCMEFIWAHPERPGLEVGLIVAAIMVPWTPVQAAAIKWYFEARTDGT